MNNNDFSQFCAKKAFEITYAIFRLSKNLENNGLREHFEHQALNLLSFSSASNYGEVLKSLSAIDYFTKLGSAIDLISVKNSEVIIIEIAELSSAIREFVNSQRTSEINIEGIFSKPLLIEKRTQEEEVFSNQDFFPPKEEVSDNANLSINAGIRQSEILQKIRQSGSCRIKEIQELLPNISERTLRYDLQKLAERGLIHKVGSSGPGTFYSVKSQ